MSELIKPSMALNDTDTNEVHQQAELLTLTHQHKAAPQQLHLQDSYNWQQTSISLLPSNFRPCVRIRVEWGSVTRWLRGPLPHSLWGHRTVCLMWSEAQEHHRVHNSHLSCLPCIHQSRYSTHCYHLQEFSNDTTITGCVSEGNGVWWWPSRADGRVTCAGPPPSKHQQDKKEMLDNFHSEQKRKKKNWSGQIYKKGHCWEPCLALWWPLWSVIKWCVGQGVFWAGQTQQTNKKS